MAAGVVRFAPFRRSVVRDAARRRAHSIKEMHPMETIVVGVDGSEASLKAVDVGAALVRDLPDAQLVAVFSSFMPYHFPEAEPHLDTYGVEVRVRDINDAVKVHLDGTDTPWLFERHEGEPARELADVAEKLGARLIVVGRN